jgi:hypothetical protein
MEVIPLSAVPLIGVSIKSTTGIPSAETPSATPLTAMEKTIELAKSMEEMNLQETKIRKLKKEVENLQELKSSYQTNYSKEKQTSDKLKHELQQLQKQTVAGKTLADVNGSVWMDITKSINEIWPMVQIRPPCPTGIRLLKTSLSVHSPIAYFVLAPEILSLSYLRSSQPSKITIIPTNILFELQVFSQ